MTAAVIYSLAGLALFGAGLWGVAALPHLLRKVIAVNIMSVGVFVVLVSIAFRGPGGAHDPVPHAMVLTGIVVSVSATGLALSLVRRYAAGTGSSVLISDSSDDASAEVD